VRLILSFAILFSFMALLMLVAAQNPTIMAQRYVFRLDLMYVQIHFDPVRLDILLLLSVLSGFVWATLFALPQWFSRTLTMRQLKKTVKGLEKNKNELVVSADSES
jgi:uncharacterized membrane protein YciS (DUF1049 family)